MKTVFCDWLFNHGILVCGEKETPDRAFAARFILEHTFGICVVNGKSLVTAEMIPYAAGKLGKNVPEPFYKGFPDSVRELSPDQLLFDQLLHYIRTYYMGDFSKQGHSEMEEYIERSAFSEECSSRNFDVLTETEATTRLEGYVEAFLAGTRPLSDDQYTFVCEFIREYDYTVNNCASKNLAIRLLLDFRDEHYAEFIKMSDVIKLVDELNYRFYGGTNLRKLNLKNQDRKLITKVINGLFQSDHCDIRNCYEKKALWCGLLHHIHYQPADDISARFVQSIRGKGNLSVFSEFERAMAEKDIRGAVTALKTGKGSGAVLRNLFYILSRCNTAEELQYVISQLDSTNGIVLLQLLMTCALQKGSASARTFKFARYNKLITHHETTEEQARRKSVISEETAVLLSSVIKESLQSLYHGRLGKVYIDSAMANIALPVQENTSSSGYGVLPKGSRIHIEEGKKIRAFTYWEKVNDIDLSVIGIRADGSQTEFSWRTMYSMQSGAITYSGDETSGYNGGSEYFDIDVEKFRAQYPDVEYLIFCDNVFSGSKFNDCICRAGYMLRDVMDSGEIYEPKTVKTSFTIDCDSTFAYLFAIDLEKSDFIWLNIAKNSWEHVAGDTGLEFLTAYFDLTSVMNMKEFFTMLATEVVENEADADVIVTDAVVQDDAGKEIIRSCDFERMIQLMN